MYSKQTSLGPYDYVTRFFEIDPKDTIMLRVKDDGTPFFWVFEGENVTHMKLNIPYFETFKVEYIKERGKFRIEMKEPPMYDINKYEIVEETHVKPSKIHHQT